MFEEFSQSYFFIFPVRFDDYGTNKDSKSGGSQIQGPPGPPGKFSQL